MTFNGTPLNLGLSARACTTGVTRKGGGMLMARSVSPNLGQT